ncbi:MAG TPA: CpsD/CapB family tyrosine-protein kinase [Patescibacteria group bacterium]|nr:CpsD/CapB family tyrosine-protein kinase [Patescibacteria group bacterium]
MSRIHEALKLAEQERRSRQVSERPAPLPEREIALPQMSETGKAPGPARGVGTIDSPIPVPEYSPEPASIESLIASCRQPAWNPDGKTMLFSQEDNRQYKFEVFRTLRSRLYRLRDLMPLRTLLITSTLPAEGKSFIAANLSQAIAQQHGRRVLLIDADLRMPRLHTLLGAPQCPGLTEYLRGEVDEISAIQRGPRNGFYFLSCGDTVPDPVELIANGRMRGLIERLKHAFDWIVLDSPPMAPVSDASLLADMCDGALLVVRSAATPFDLAQKACAEFKGTPLLGVVLNGISRNSSYGGYYHSYYGPDSEKSKE